ncbi:hypothetical protein H9P43_001645 [Blastocladiella emersonii ATCC 22665]|nr:hypothetical protein H9P43_001645 [Blastocladiella emersonii ATCC 22665]
MPLPSPSFPTWALESNLAASFVEGVTGKLYNPGNMFEVPLALVLIGGVGQLDATRPLRFKARFRFFCIQDGKSTTYPGVRGGVAHGEEHAGDHEFGGALVDGRIEFAVPLTLEFTSVVVDCHEAAFEHRYGNLKKYRIKCTRSRKRETRRGE